MYNYKITEHDLADFMIYKMSKNKGIKKTLDICIVIFSIVIVTVLMLIIKSCLPEFNIVSLFSGEILLSGIIIIAVFKNYKNILARVYKREVNNKAYKYDFTITIQGRKLKVYNQDREDEYKLDEIRIEQTEKAVYLISENKIIIVPSTVFKSKEEKEDFLKNINIFKN